MCGKCSKSNILFFNSSLLMFWDIFQTDDNSGCFMIVVVLSALSLGTLLDILKFWECSDILGDCFVRELENEM